MESGGSVVHLVSILSIQVGVILFAARFCGRAVQKLKLPPVLGELAAGIVIGPYLLGSLGFPGFPGGLFPLPSAGSAIPVSLPLYGLATLGSIVLLFMSGLETDLRLLFRYSVVGIVVGVGGVIVSFVAGDLLACLAWDIGFMHPRSLFLGILCTATSVGITARILSEKRSMDTAEGTTILAAAVIDDVLGIICLAVVVGLLGAGSDGNQVDWGQIGVISLKSVGIWLGFTTVGILFAHKIASFLKMFRPGSTFAILALGAALLLAGIFEQAGLAMIIGAYVMGLSLSRTDIAFTLQRCLHGVYDFLVPVFFVVMGMMVDVRVLTDGKVLLFGLCYTVLAILSKIIGCGLPAYCMNFNVLGAARIGIGMIPRGEVALIIAGIGATTMMSLSSGQQEPVINSQLFGVTIIMTLLTTIAAPPLLAFVLSIKGRGVKKEVDEVSLVHTRFTLPSEFVADFVLRALIDNLRLDGFRHSELDREAGLINFRREATSFTLRICDGRELDFESSVSEVTLLKTAFYEILVDLSRNLKNLEETSRPLGMDETMRQSGVLGDGLHNRPPVSVGHLLSEHGVVIRLVSHTVTGAIEEMIDALAWSGKLLNKQACLEDVLARESIVSTSLAEGVALPHARTSGVKDLVFAVGISKEGISPEDDHVVDRLFVLSLSPRSGEGPYLQFISRMAQILSIPGNIDRIVSGNEAREVIQILSSIDSQH